ncbi:MAG TPA: adenylosuccinate synthase [Polyangiaceae bacterium]|nr:adenylosuccinate synthase [Polyangiaceae bacterium]
MSAVVVVGAQWGDEGKGKVVDLLTEHADVVVRYAGGANAGHTLYVGDEKVVMRLVPSGILRPGVRCVLGQGMVVDPSVLVGELDELERRGRRAEGDLRVSERAHLLFPYHALVDGLREGAAAPGEGIGTTKRGIGPAYEDKAARRGVPLGALRSPELLRRLVARALEAWAPVVRALGGALPSVDEACAPALAAAPRLVPLLDDASRLVDGAVRAGRRVLLEGAQGTLLDIDHGTYPFVTSSSAIAGGACTGAGIGPGRISYVLGITKAYATRVGAGPFPTELHDATGARLREAGDEFGSVTGRPRRTGWLDLPALRYAARVNGLDGLAVTKLDVLSGLPEVRACVAYEGPAGRVDELPATPYDDLSSLRPVYEALPGWGEGLSSARSMDELPRAARAYLAFVEERVGVPIALVSVGPRRGETIALRNPFEGRG